MPARSLIVLSVDALATAPLQPYGCSWLETHGLNRLSAASAVFDRAIASSLDRAEVLRQYVCGVDGQASVVETAASLGMPTLLFTDSPAVASMPAIQSFDECTLISVDPSADAVDSQPPLALDLEDTLLARLFAAALLRRESLDDSPHLIWIHASSLLHTWDAPMEFRPAEDLAGHDLEEGDPEEGDLNEHDQQLEAGGNAVIEAVRGTRRPPRLVLEEDDDPDLVWAWMCAYGAQVRVLDALLEVLVDTVEDDQTSLVLASTSGFSLGEHGWIGADAGPPRSPRIHLPLVVMDPARSPVRSLRPVSSARLAPTLVEMLRDPETAENQGGAAAESLWCEVEPERWAEVDEPTSPACLTSPADREPELVLKTAPGWFYVRSADQAEYLFLKPDDRNDVNDVASLRPDVLEEFR